MRNGKEESGGRAHMLKGEVDDFEAGHGADAIKEHRFALRILPNLIAEVFNRNLKAIKG